MGDFVPLSFGFLHSLLAMLLVTHRSHTENDKKERNFMQVKSICGIDTLYYFAQSNEVYENAFFDLLNQLDAQTKLHETDIYAYAHSSMIVKLGTTALKYLGKDKGVYNPW